MKALVLTLPFVVALASCDPNSSGDSAIEPNACGDISTTDVGRKMQSFLTASAELDIASIDLELAVLDTCLVMAQELGIATDGTTEEICARVNLEIQDSLEVSVSTEQRLVTRTEPPVCTTEIDFAADVAATCEATVSTEIDVRCDGRCTATCDGVCNGNCSLTNADGSCSGTCDGICEGSCTGACEGGALVDTSAECKASAEVRANVSTVCTDAKVVVVREDVTVIDSTRFDRAVAAIEVGLPTLLTISTRAELVAGSLANWTATASSLAGASVSLAADLGANAVCVAGQLGAVVAAAAPISARIDVSISVSASVSASAGATEPNS